MSKSRRTLALVLSAGLFTVSAAPGVAQTPPGAPPAPASAQPQPQTTPGAQPQPQTTPGTQPQPGTAGQQPGTQGQGGGGQPGTPQGQPTPGATQPQTTPGTQPQPGAPPPAVAPGTTTQPGTTAQPGTQTTQPASGTTTGGASGTSGTPGTTPSSGTTGPQGGAAGAGRPGNTGPGGVGAQGAPNPPPPVPTVLPPVPNIAPGYSPASGIVPTGDLVGVAQQPFVGIALRDAVAMALQRNTDLAIAASNQRIANYQIVAAQGAYDVRFQLVPQYAHAVSPAVSAFQAGPGNGPVTQDTAGATAALQGETQQGGQYHVGLTGTRITSNSTVNSYNPFYETALQFTLTQPLARGRATDQTRLQLQLARTNAAIANQNALLQASNTVVQVADAYYDLAAGWRNVGIQEQGLRNAEAQAASNARLAARGAVAPTDIVEANTQVNVFQDNVFAALQNVARLQTQIKSLILANPGDPVWLANLVPTTAITEIPQEPTLTALITSAIANRPEIAQLRSQRENANTNLAYARDQLRPQIDLGLGYTANGFAGNPVPPSNNPIFGILGAQIGAINELIVRSNAINPTAPPIPLLGGFAFASPAYQTGGLGQAFANTFDNRFPTYSAQITYQIPFGNRTARANYGIAEEQARQVAIQETSLLQRIRSEAVNAIQGLRETQYRLNAAHAAVVASQRVLLGEQRRFQAGTSTTFLVLQRQLDVANNQGRELQAQTDLDKAIVELNRVSGGIFAQNGIDASALGASTLNAASPTQSNLPPAAPAPAPPVTRRPG